MQFFPQLSPPPPGLLAVVALCLTGNICKADWINPVDVPAHLIEPLCRYCSRGKEVFNISPQPCPLSQGLRIIGPLPLAEHQTMQTKTCPLSQLHHVCTLYIIYSMLKELINIYNKYAIHINFIGSQALTSSSSAPCPHKRHSLKPLWLWWRN